MSRYLVLLICAIAVVVQGRPRLHHKHKQAQNPGSKDPQVNRRQHADHQTFSDVPKSPQNLNIYNVHVHKMDDKNKGSGHIAPHSAGVSMQGPGTTSLSTTQQVVGSDEAKPDHTVSMVKDTGGCSGPECSMVNVHSGHKLPIPLPLTGPSTPIQSPKQSKPHDRKFIAQTAKEPLKLQGHSSARHADPGKINHVVHNQVDKEQASEIINGLESSIPVTAHKPKYEQPSVQEHVEVHAAAERSDHGKVSHALSHMTKESANEMITGVENGVSVVTYKPKKDVQVNNGHKVFISNPGNPQKVFGQMDSNNVGVTAQGQGTVSVTSQFDVPQLSQTVIFDPMEPCSGPSCPRGTGSEHKDRNLFDYGLTRQDIHQEKEKKI